MSAVLAAVRDVPAEDAVRDVAEALQAHEIAARAPDKERADPFLQTLNNLHWSKLVVNGKAPAPRWGHASCTIGNQIHYFGGSGTQLLNDYVIYDAVDNTWSSVALSGQVPGGRFGHAIAVLANRLYLFGGNTTTSKPHQDLYLMDLDTFHWTKHPADKSWPESRAGHTFTVVPEKSIIVGFGGHNTRQKYYNGVFVLEKVGADKVVNWRSPKLAGAAPTPRSSHSATLVGDKLFVFGGFDGRKYFNDLHILEMSGETWTWRTTAPKGKIPAARSGHTATLVAGKLWILGGCSSDSSFLNDLHILEPDTCTWYYVGVKGTAFPPRFKHTANLMKNGMHVFGGTGSGTLFSDIHVLERVGEEALGLEGPVAVGAGPSLAKSAEIALKVGVDAAAIALALQAEKDRRQQLEAALANLRIALASEKEAKEKAEGLLASKEGEFLLVQDNLKRFEGDKQKLEQQLRTEHDRGAKLEKSAKAEKEKRHKAHSSKEGLEKTVETQKAALESLEQRLKGLETSLARETQLRTQFEAEVVRLRAQETDSRSRPRPSKDASVPPPAATSAPPPSSSLAAVAATSPSSSSSSANKLPLSLDLSTLAVPELDALESEQLLLLTKVMQQKSANLLRAEAELQKLRIDKIVTEEKKALADRALQAAQKDNEALRTQVAVLEQRLAQAEKRSQELERKANILSTNLEGYTSAELEELEDYCQQSVKKLNTAKQLRFANQLEMLKREKEQLQDQRKCVVCVDRDVSTVIIPCGHRACCPTCAGALTKCPLCRSEITSVVQTY